MTGSQRLALYALREQADSVVEQESRAVRSIAANVTLMSSEKSGQERKVVRIL